jgi:GNAT superfamily N-acetyltransferase
MARASERMTFSTARGPGLVRLTTSCEVFTILLDVAGALVMLTTDYEISTDRGRLNVAWIHEHLSTSYWAHGRPRDVVERSIEHSLCFGVYHKGTQVAFARAVTDHAVFAYLADVIVAPNRRGQGIGKALVDAIVNHDELKGVPVILLRTRDAHGLYSQCGFGPLPHPHEMMVRPAP